MFGYSHGFYNTRQKKTNRTIGQKRQPWLIMSLISLILLGGIGSRLVYLQLLEGEVYREKAENNRIRIIPKPPVRGNIFDRKGRVLASTRLTHAAYLWPVVIKESNWEENLRYLSQLLSIPEDNIERKIKQAGYNPSTLIRVARSLNPAQITALEEFKSELNGLEVDIESVRNYPNQDLAAHVLGYTGELNAEQLSKRRSEGYRLGDTVGKMGVEAAYEQQLRGEWGGLQLEVDGVGKVVKVLGQKIGKAGKDVTLTLDLDVQKSAEAALGQRKGAIVAIDPRDGGVLAMVSYPRFNPNVFSSQINTETWEKWRSQGDPFVNRALRGFPPASIFKIVTATAGMETEKYPPNTVLNTFAYLNVGGTAFGEWNRAGFGPMGYVRAMAWSSNTFHGQIGRGVGGPTLIKWARNYGFGDKTGIELEEEARGLIADDTWKRKNYSWGWTDGDTVNMSIGQGFTQATPLQVAIMFAVPANGGYRVKPHFLKGDEDVSKWRTSMNLKPSTITTLTQGLRAVVSSGTGKALNSPNLPPVAGKTGTAEAPPGKVHAWFGGYAPYNKPEIVVVAFAEHSGGGGGSVAALMVRQVMEAYFKNKK
ncbi:penicillin binding protein, transpeptidase [cyanobacterium endosymbiont of Rhopalodia gibberula]|uniref:penicillin-binding protein 2 n=1 Tax=cyanobacterium endosymbiont of Rhopalodia gibberula TaxID=1763363 RepID=UPI000DC72712|nr:penicillin-binding protein 2 [cyanobacterium endosymbiont of Rhopalodia gibberula]BBA78867.1 penicillin binding protein, transpeptidase [cyanobacterium endosymbiont of Rhopalodia gibberula]